MGNNSAWFSGGSVGNGRESFWLYSSQSRLIMLRFSREWVKLMIMVIGTLVAFILTTLGLSYSAYVGFMERRKMKQPLLIGGATTSKIHTAVKIVPGYSNSIVHVKDASKSVPVVSSLFSSEKREQFITRNRDEHEALRIKYESFSGTLFATGKLVLSSVPFTEEGAFKVWSDLILALGFKHEIVTT